MEWTQKQWQQSFQKKISGKTLKQLVQYRFVVVLSCFWKFWAIVTMQMQWLVELEDDWLWSGLSSRWTYDNGKNNLFQWNAPLDVVRSEKFLVEKLQNAIDCLLPTVNSYAFPFVMQDIFVDINESAAKLVVRHHKVCGFIGIQFFHFVNVKLWKWRNNNR